MCQLLKSTEMQSNSFNHFKSIEMSESTANQSLVEFGRYSSPFERTAPLPIKIKYKFGTQGGFQEEFDNPTGFCLGANDDIIIADKNNHRIQIFDKNGIFKFKFGNAGKCEGDLWLPSNVSVLRNDYRLLVSDQGVERSRLQVFSENGIFMKKIPFYGISTVAALDVMNDGNIVIVDRPSSIVFIIDEIGTVLQSIECKMYLVQPSDVAVHGTEIFICDYKAHCVAVFSTDGTFHGYITNDDALCYPSGVYVTENDVFVSHSNDNRFHVVRFGRSGLFKASYVCMQMKVSYCHGFKMNSDGDAFTVSRGRHCMAIMDKMSFKQ